MVSGKKCSLKRWGMSVVEVYTTVNVAEKLARAVNSFCS